jgi:nucleoside 2-deoxyribosyltransferase
MIPNRPKVYLAAPLFSETELSFNRSLRDKLSDLADVYLPQDDGELLVELVREGVPVEQAKRRIFQSDIVAIEGCDILVIVMDGRIIDEGACFELGYAFSRGKACVGIKTDVRSLLPFGDNPMVECALQRIFRDVDDLIDWIRESRWKPL